MLNIFKKERKIDPPTREAVTALAAGEFGALVLEWASASAIDLQQENSEVGKARVQFPWVVFECAVFFSFTIAHKIFEVFGGDNYKDD